MERRKFTSEKNGACEVRTKSDARTNSVTPHCLANSTKYWQRQTFRWVVVVAAHILLSASNAKRIKGADHVAYKHRSAYE